MREKPQKQIKRKSISQTMKDDVLNWLFKQPQQKAEKEALLKQVPDIADLNLFLSDSRFVKYDQSGATWIQTTHEYLRQYRQRKRDISNWIVNQPGQQVSLSEFKQVVNHSLQEQHFLTKGEFTIVGSTEKWVKMTPKNEVYSLQLLSRARHWLEQKENQISTYEEFARFINSSIDLKFCLSDNNFVTFIDHGQKWVQTLHYSMNRQQESALVKRKQVSETNMKMNDWSDCLDLCGELQRSDINGASSDRQLVIARTYAVDTAARRIGLPAAAIRAAIADGLVIAFIDPDNHLRVPVYAVENAIHNPEFREQISGYIPLKVRHVSIVSGMSYSTTRSRLRKANLTNREPLWQQVRSLWGLPATYAEFKTLLDDRYPIWVESALTEETANNDKLPAGIGNRASHDNLRRQLLEVFPTWEGSLREDQRIILHIGQTNSGKTHHGLNRLIRTGSGWYLSPLRLLAHEVFDRLNQSGTLCNLLTGEETIPVEGARITAATIEMFNSAQSGACVLIDEAHMLADSQRGWAWTRALMETKSPEIHVIGSPIAERLVRQMADQIGVPVETNEYQRLVPLDTALKPWTLSKLPPRTILVAFSRHMVLGLKTELEKSHRRSVSVIYGNLPPEVRLRQAERFANGETEICVATDAIGMGINLPADHVCFYETRKYDGQGIRTLTDHEIIQIGGRAGRYGLSNHGLIGALTAEDLSVVRQAVHQPADDIAYAYVAPSPASIALLPGRLADKLQTWVYLQGIPDRWREILKPVDLSNQINLARQLTDKDIAKVGEETSLLLINAPCDQNTQFYWRNCADMIIQGLPMPLPEKPPLLIRNAEALVSYELAIRCADIYLWLSQRPPFAHCGLEAEMLRDKRNEWTMKVDEALQKQIDTGRRCSNCGRPLVLNHRYNLCDRCHRQRRNRYNDF